MVCKPPMSALEIRQWRAMKKRQAMEICKRLRDILVAAIGLSDPVHQPVHTVSSFAEHDLDAKPNRADKPGDDHGNDGLEGVALRLLYALSPAPQMLKVRA